MWDFAPFILTLKLSLVTTAILFIVGVPLAYWLAYSRFKIKVVVEALVALPIVLPPSVLGFYLLLAFSPQNTFGRLLHEYLDIQFVFSFPGLVIASLIYSMPFMVQPIQSGFQQLPRTLLDAAYTLGKGRMTTLIKVLLPNIKASLLTGCILAFAHTIGEFGVVLMVGGNIPDETRVISIAIYDEVESMNYDKANMYSIALLAFSFMILTIVYIINYNHRRKIEIL
ncbi:molybdate ABC transporter permease subunit [Pseudochryseolinea flava]|uniref:Molybdenum transport system permease n=1 Tax=Pseudochryseolinea flava TaxID=2059302 RepID=A0A364Y6A5_9BACT|nr:molybdate ABC transporter permease subunit [Pseudochryseolinea flava]RAW02372.1 molybdate ABC transporter permease subunit [Pseudochryseolinea flava]